mgnify:CR=1 FL=1
MAKEEKKDSRYTWIHIPENYFDRVKTKVIRGTENGDIKIVLYLKILDAVKNTDGYYLFQHATKSISEEIALQINEDAKLVKDTLDTLNNLELVEIEEDGIYFNESEQFVGTILESTLRVQEHRAKEKAKKIKEAKQKETECNSTKQTNITSETECNNSMLQGKQTNVTSETECNTEKEREKDKEINNNCAKSNHKKEIDECFERLWKEYPNKRGKGQISEAKKKRLFEVGEEHIKKAIERYLNDLSKESWRKTQNGSTFFSSGYVDYLDQNYEKSLKSQQRNPASVLSCEHDYDFGSLEQQLLHKQWS